MAARAEPDSDAPEILARGPWAIGADPRALARGALRALAAARREAADAAIREPAGARLAQPRRRGRAARRLPRGRRAGIAIELQPLRWALRLVADDASQSMAALCVTRSADGRWLAGRRAPWVASWAGRWALGAGGAVDLGENPADTLVRELQEEWAVAPERVRGEALLRLPHQLVMFVGQAWLAEGAEETRRPDHEHDAFAWWPARDRRLAGRGRRGAAARWPAGCRSEHELRGGRRAADLHAPEVDLVHPLLRLSRAADLRLRGRQARAADVRPRPRPTGCCGSSCRWPASPPRGCASSRCAWPSRSRCSAGSGPFFGSYEFVREQRQREPARPASGVNANSRFSRPTHGRKLTGGEVVHRAQDARVRNRWQRAPRLSRSIDVVTPAAGESVTEGTILEWHVKVGDQIKVDDDDRRDLHRQGRRRAALARERHGQRDPRRRGRHGHRRPGDRAHRRRRRRERRRRRAEPTAAATATAQPPAAASPRHGDGSATAPSARRRTRPPSRRSRSSTSSRPPPASR